MRVPLQILLLSTALSLVGCSSRFDRLCAEAVDCEGGRDRDIDACVAAAEGDEDVAAAHDCSAEFDDYFDCVERRAFCDTRSAGGAGSWSTYDSYSGTSSCVAEEDRLSRCNFPPTVRP